MRQHSFEVRPAQRPVALESWRRLAARVLASASATLARQARDVARPLHARRRRPAVDATYEFHAEAGAPEGALYRDGEFIGVIGVQRL